MSKLIHTPIGIENGIVKTKTEVKYALCKTCLKEPRRHGSQFGEKCAAAYRAKNK